MAAIDPTGKVPPYRQVAEIIAAKIASGEYARGSRIPTESELVEIYEICPVDGTAGRRRAA